MTKEANLCEFEMDENSIIYIFGGIPFPEPRIINWNFVSSDKTLIQKARENWKLQNWPKVPEEIEYVKLPEK